MIEATLCGCLACMKTSAALALQRICAWSGVVSVLLFILGVIVLARMWPPPAPGLDANQIVAIFSGNLAGIRSGGLVAMIAGALLAPWFAVISIQLRRIEGPFRTLTYLQLASGAVTVWAFIFPMVLLEGAVFRLDRDPEVTLAISDLCWLFLIGFWFTIVFQYLAVGVAILMDEAAAPVFERWVGYVNIWCVLLSVPAGAIYFLKSGPLSWNGLFSLWLPGIVYLIWVLVMTQALLRAMKCQASAALSQVGASVPVYQ